MHRARPLLRLSQLAWWGFLLGALCQSACVHALECTAHGGPTWYQVESPHFVLKTNKHLEEAKDDAVFLEKLYFVMRWLFAIESDPADPLTVIAVAHSDDLLRFGIDAAGMAVPDGPSRYLILSGSSEKSKRGQEARVFAHELAHLVSRIAMPVQPDWLSEGFAEYAGATLLLDAATAKVGLMPVQTVDLAGVAPIAQLWAWSYATMSDAQRHWYYFSAWAWAHSLFNTEESRFRSFIAQTKTGGDPRQLFEQAFPVQWQQEAKAKVDAYVLGGHYFSTTLRVPTPTLALSTRTLSPSEVHLLRSKLAEHSTLSKRTSEQQAAAVTAEVEQARSLGGPPTVELWEALRIKEPTLTAPAPTSPREEARLLLHRSGEGDVNHSLELLKSARAKSPNDAEVLEQLANVTRELGDSAEEALEAVREARRLRPWWPRAWLREAEIALLAGKCTDATQAMSRYVDVTAYDAAATKRALGRLASLRTICAETLATGSSPEALVVSARARFAACYELSSTAKPSSVRLRATLGRDGTIHRTSIVADRLDRTVRDCLRGVARTLVFRVESAERELVVEL